MTLPYSIAALFEPVPPVSSIQAAKQTIGARIKRDLTETRLVDMPPDLRRAVRLLAKLYRERNGQ